MTITNLTTEQRAALARQTLQILAELWCDQHGIDAVIQIVQRDAAHDLKEERSTNEQRNETN